MDREQLILVAIDSQTVNRLLLAHFRITRSAGVQAELLISEGERANAYAGLMNARRVIGINTAMVKLIGDDIDEYAALLGHEAAHWAKGHVDAGRLRSSTIQAIGNLIGAGLSMTGIPAAGLITGLGADMIDTTFSREDEREADVFGIEYMLANGFDPEAAVRLHEKMLKLPGGVRVPFLSSHPSGEERIDNLKNLIAAKKTQQPAEPERLDDR
ncbi:MAG TPA: M48 family metalloprotease [Candidatus Binatia bacterium]|nr:M48 family metalloprotease [Candidatus Binatia bacterium]